MSAPPAPTPVPTLVCRGRHAAKPPLALRQPVILIGSGDGVQLRLKSPAIAPAHALLVTSGGRIHLRRLTPAADLHVNGHPARAADLSAGDVLALGGFEFQFQPGPSDAAAPPDVDGELVEVGGPWRAGPDQAVTLFGGNEDCDVRIDGAPTAEVLAAVCRVDGRHVVRALHAATPARVNGQSVRQAVLKVGDTLHLAGAEFRYQSRSERPVGSAVPPEAPPEPAPTATPTPAPARPRPSGLGRGRSRAPSILPPAAAAPRGDGRRSRRLLLVGLVLLSLTGLADYAIWRWLPVAARVEGELAFEAGPARPMQASQADELLRSPGVREAALRLFSARYPAAPPGLLDASSPGQVTWRPQQGGWDVLTIARDTAEPELDAARLDALLAAAHAATADGPGTAPAASSASSETARLKLELLRADHDDLRRQLVGVERRAAELREEIRVIAAAAPSDRQLAELKADVVGREAAFQGAVRGLVIAQLQAERLQAALTAPVTKYNVLAAAPADAALLDLMAQWGQAQDALRGDGDRSKPPPPAAELAALQGRVGAVERQVRVRLAELTEQARAPVDDGQRQQEVARKQYLAAQRRLDQAVALGADAAKRQAELDAAAAQARPLRAAAEQKGAEVAAAEAALAPKGPAAGVAPFRSAPPGLARVVDLRDARGLWVAACTAAGSLAFVLVAVGRCGDHSGSGRPLVSGANQISAMPAT